MSKIATELAYLAARYPNPTRTILIKTCGHELDITNHRHWPAVGEQIACYSSCDFMGRHIVPRYVARYESREVQA